MIYNVARVRRLSTKFQVGTYKTKRDRSAHAQLTPCNWDSSHDLWCSKGQEVMHKISSQYVKKIKIFILGVIFGGALGAGDLTAVNIKSWVTLAMAWKTQIWISVMNGPIGWEEFDDRQKDRQTDDRQTDDRQTENSNPSVPYDAFACFAHLIKQNHRHS